jgi:hypothetical protein
VGAKVSEAMTKTAAKDHLDLSAFAQGGKHEVVGWEVR